MWPCNSFIFDTRSPLGATDTLASKNLFECKAMHCSQLVDSYHTNNGIFTKMQFCNALLATNQGHTVSGVSTHHQTGPAECAIRTIQDITRTMMVHLSVHWPDEYDVCLWPFAMDYAVWLYNHTLHHDSGLAPLELCCGTWLNCEALRRAKVFECPT